MKKVIIVEDEKASQELLESFISEYCPQLSLLGIYSKKDEIISALNSNEPSIVFFDIELEDCTAFEVLEELDAINFKIIFITAYKNYAYRAFKYNAIDYLLKPYSPQEFIEAVDKTTDQDVSLTLLKKIGASLQAKADRGNQRISIPTFKGINLVSIKDIIRAEADGSYCKLILSNKDSIIVSKKLKDLEQLVENGTFFRVHASHLINIHNVSEYLKEDGGQVIMSNGDSVPISRRKKTTFLDMLSDLPHE